MVVWLRYELPIDSKSLGREELFHEEQDMYKPYSVSPQSFIGVRS
jgi:hypothetical protein